MFVEPQLEKYAKAIQKYEKLSEQEEKTSIKDDGDAYFEAYRQASAAREHVENLGERIANNYDQYFEADLCLKRNNMRDEGEPF